MGFFARLFGIEDGKTTFREVSCADLFGAAADYTIRRLAFDSCVDLVANAVGLCEFQTYRAHEPIQEAEYWLWNFEPGINESSSVFLHKLVDSLYRKNEALVIPTRVSGGIERMAVADDWVQDEAQVTRENQYRQVRVDDLTFHKTFRESEVLHFKLNQKAMEPVLRALADSWNRMAALAQKHYEWDRGQHWKVHVNQLAAGADDFDANFAKMIAQQMQPFLESGAAVLPEFDGYDYQLVGGSSGGSGSVSDLRSMVEDIFNFTAMGFLIPAVLVNGKVESTKDANSRFLTYVVDPICAQIQEEGTRKKYGYDGWRRGDYLVVDTSGIIHYDLFGEAANIEKLVGSGVYSINDLRRETGQAIINEPWANEHFMTLNIKPIKDVARPLDE